MLRRIINSSPSGETSSGNSLRGKINLKNNEIIKATVTGRLEGNNFLVSARGSRFRAFSSQPLTEGGRYSFRVIKGDNRIELKIVDDTPQSGKMVNRGTAVSERVISARLGKILNHLTNTNISSNLSRESAAILKKIRTFMTPELLDGNRGNVSWISRNIQGSGVFWENKLLQYLMGKRDVLLKKITESDLKGLLLSLRGSMEVKESDSDELASLTSRLKEALELIDREQLQNITPHREGQGWLIHLTGLRDEGFEGADLHLKKRKEKEGNIFSVYMEMTSLGKMELNVAMTGSKADMAIFLSDEEKVKYVKGRLKELEKGLTESGLMVGRISCGIKDFENIDDSECMDDFSSVHVVI